MISKEFHSELNYQVTIMQAKRLLEEGIITIEVFNEFKERLFKKYYPILSKYMDETLDK